MEWALEEMICWGKRSEIVEMLALDGGMTAFWIRRSKIGLRNMWAGRSPPAPRNSTINCSTEEVVVYLRRSKKRLY